MNKRIRYVAVDDDFLELLAMSAYAAPYAFLESCGTFTSITDALVAIGAAKPDLIFLDIEMPGLSGLDLLRKVREQVPMAVFITSHPEFALEGYELSALDYVLKPLTEDRFALTMKRVQEYWEMKQKAQAYEVLFEQDVVTIKEGYNQVRLSVNDILYLEAMQDYTKIVARSNRYMTLSPLSHFMERLPAKRFMRVHRSYAVAMDKIEELHSAELICGGASIPIGKTYRTAVAQLKL